MVPNESSDGTMVPSYGTANAQTAICLERLMHLYSALGIVIWMVVRKCGIAPCGGYACYGCENSEKYWAKLIGDSQHDRCYGPGGADPAIAEPEVSTLGEKRNR